MIVIIDTDIIRQLTCNGTLAYIAVGMRGDGIWSTADLAGSVAARTATIREGLTELAQMRPDLVRRDKKKWLVGTGLSTGLQILELQSTRKDFIDDLKKFWDFLNPSLPFSISAKDGRAIGILLRDNPDWTRQMWQAALQNRARSEVARSQPFFAWISRLTEYASGPLDRYGKPKIAGVKHEQAINIETGNRAARDAALGRRAQG